MTRPLRIAAIGCGLAAKQLHAPAIGALPAADLVALCDRNPEAVASVSASVAARSGATPLAFDDPSRMLAEVEPDVVLVLTPTDSHEALATLALEAGAHVLVEKPFSDSAESAARMLATSKRCDRRLSVVHNELFTPGLSDLRARLARGEIGEVSSVHYLTSSRNQRYVPHAWYFEARGGRMGETLPHALCLLDELIPDLRVRSVEAAHLGHAILPDWVQADSNQVDDLRVELASGDGRRLGSIWYSMNSWVPTSVLVAGSEGHLLAYPFGDVTELSIEPPPMARSLRALEARIRRGLERRLRRIRKRRNTARIEDSSHYAQLAHFFDALRTNQVPRPDAESAWRVTALWETIIDRIEERPVSPARPSED